MKATYEVRAIRGGYDAHVVSDRCAGFAQGKTRASAVEGAATLFLRSLADDIDSGDISLAGVFPIQFEEEPGGAHEEGT